VILAVLQKKAKKNLYNGRHAKINIPYNVSKFPVELLTLSKQNGETAPPFLNLVQSVFTNIRFKCSLASFP
jgi:hypothetical protein